MRTWAGLTDAVLAMPTFTASCSADENAKSSPAVIAMGVTTDLVSSVPTAGAGTNMVDVVVVAVAS
jgi:hypothetical protein